MRKIRIIIAGLLALALVLTGCSLFAPEETVLTPPSVDSGEADFTTFVALGNSLTAGYQSGALYQSTQTKGFAALLAAAMATDFELPLIEDPGFYDPALPVGHLDVSFDDDGGVSIAPVPWPGGPGSPPALLNATLTAPYHNLGVPGALTVDLLNAYDAGSSASGDNNYFDMILRNGEIDWTQLGGAAADLSTLEQAILLDPTFVSLWIGNNEILGAATAGSGTPLVDSATFGFLYDLLVTGLVTSLPDADFVFANIPPVTAATFFTTIPWYVFNPADMDTVDIDPITPGTQMTGLIAEDGGPDFQLEDGDRVTIKLLSFDGNENGTPDLEEGMGFPRDILIGLLMLGGMSAEMADEQVDILYPLNNTPIPGALTLNTTEILELADATAAFNGIIAAEAAEHDIPVVDIHSRFAAMAGDGVDWNGHHYTTDFVTGGIFSLDGVHPSTIGHAIATSWFIEVINETYGSNLEMPSAPIVPRAVPETSSRLPRFPQGYPALP